MTTEEAAEAAQARPTLGVPAEDAGPVFEVARLTRGFPELPRPAVDGVSFEVARGEVFGVLGRNGAGKTTLLRLMAGLLRPDAGSVRLLGAESAASPSRVAERVAYLPQNEAALSDMTVATAVESTGRLRGLSRRQTRTRTAALLAELELDGLAGKRMARLSSGQRRLVAVATALIADRPALVLDEPTAGLDLGARRAVWAALNRRRTQEGTTVVLVTHNVLEAEQVLDRVLVLHRGRVVGRDADGVAFIALNTNPHRRR